MRILILILTFILGSIIPFIEYLAIVEVVLIIPLGIIFCVSIVYLTMQIKFEKPKDLKALLVAFIVPTLFASQIVSVIVVNKIQRFRSEILIYKIESLGIMNKSGSSLGLQFERDLSDRSYKISYTRGFMMTETYDSYTKTWDSLGWGWNN